MTKSVKNALRFWPFVLGMLIVIAVNRLEHFALPVVTGFTITEMQTNEKTISLSGYMRKDRNCAFAGVTAKGIEKESNQFVSIPLVFNDSKYNSTATRPTGNQDWGPWSIQIPVAPKISEVTLTSVHQCHVFWATSSHLITFPVIKTEDN